MKKKNSIQNSILHYGIFFAPFLYTGYQIQKRIKSTYNNNSSIFELFFNYQKDKQTTNINHILIDFFKNQERKNFFCLNIIECINKALREENKYDNYVTYYKTYLKEFSKKINKKFKSLLHATNKKYFLETILFHFTWELIRLKDRYNLDELKIKLEEKLQREVLPNNEEELEKIYGVIQQITKHPHIDFLAKNESNPKTIKQQVEATYNKKQASPQKTKNIAKFSKIKATLQELLGMNSINSNEKAIHELHAIKKQDELIEIFLKKLSIKESNKGDSALTFIKKEIPKIISLPSIPKFQSSPWISNIFTLSFLTLNTYPWFYFSDLKNTFNLYPKYKFKNI